MKYFFALCLSLFILNCQEKPTEAPSEDGNTWGFPYFEKVGEVNEVCFVEGLVNYKGKYFLYYGTADSKIAVAVYDPGRE
ncbi:hypothetical protein [Aureitalea sp. L0-47]|uniref:glycoside hydrolase family 130 protein n=1 Tax=Aureitalea sp. L0-47 TaxID=2816962 RepID=UPI0022378D8C|nr:hypothetical protein [Aureitalea sp. L0-47]